MRGKPYICGMKQKTDRIFRALLPCLLWFVFAGAQAQNADIRILEKFNRLDGGFARGYSKAVSKSTPYLAIGIPVLMGCYGLIDRESGILDDAIYVGTSIIEATLISYAVKYGVDRQRPFERYPDRIVPRDFPGSPSFPSGHAAMAFSLATSLSIKYPKWYVITPSALWACSVCFARMNEGVHYPSDVLAGAAIGAGCAVANYYINKGLKRLVLSRRRPALVAY